MQGRGSLGVWWALHVWTKSVPRACSTRIVTLLPVPLRAGDCPGVCSPDAGPLPVGHTKVSLLVPKA